jgi:hypothetical protein
MTMRRGQPPKNAKARSKQSQRLRPRSDQIRAWLEKDDLLLTKVHELLGREGLVVSCSALYRFARKWCDVGTASSNTMRRAESLAGEMAEVDFGRLGLLQELGSRRPRVVHGFIMTLGYSRLPCVILVFKQDLPTVIAQPRQRGPHRADPSLAESLAACLLRATACRAGFPPSQLNAPSAAPCSGPNLSIASMARIFSLANHRRIT